MWLTLSDIAEVRSHILESTIKKLGGVAVSLSQDLYDLCKILFKDSICMYSFKFCAHASTNGLLLQLVLQLFKTYNGPITNIFIYGPDNMQIMCMDFLC